METVRVLGYSFPPKITYFPVPNEQISSHRQLIRCNSSTPSTVKGAIKGHERMSGQRRFAVLRTGHATEYTERIYGGYGKMLECLLRDGDDERWDIFNVIDGDFSFETNIDSYDGFVITGSSADAHANDVPWIIYLCDILKLLHSNKKKLLGICFGHQVLARALGGKTGRASVGWELGIKSICVEQKMVIQLYGLEMKSRLNVIESHRDQVTCIPPGALVVASSEKTEVEMFAVGDNVLGIQCHPEFSKDVMMDIINRRLSGNMISSEVAKAAIESFEGIQPDQEPLKALCKAFLKGHPGVA